MVERMKYNLVIFLYSNKSFISYIYTLCKYFINILICVCVSVCMCSCVCVRECVECGIETFILSGQTPPKQLEIFVVS